MANHTLTIDGIEVQVEGHGHRTVVMIHGWPDTHRLWDGTVSALQDRYRCVRFSMPGFDARLPPRPTSLAAMATLFRSIVDAVCPEHPVTLLLHDWGCVFGYEFAARHAHRVERIIAVDIGDHNSPDFAHSLSARARWQIFSYQIWLAIAWYLGRIHAGLGQHMTRSMARRLRCPTDPATIDWPMNYPYAMQWFGLQGGFRTAAPVRPACPVLYLYGERKPFMFHSPQWLRTIGAQTGSEAQGFPSGHWVMIDQAQAFNVRVRRWLDNTGD